MVHGIAGGIGRWLGGSPWSTQQTFGRWRFRYRQRLRPDYSIVAASLMKRVPFHAMYDVGCANGFLLAEFRKAGKMVRGIDISPFVRDFVPAELEAHVEIGDFADAGFSAGGGLDADVEAVGRFDLVCCVEVAEHIPPERSEELVRKLCEIAKDYIYFTAAPPGQRGWGHINCRPYDEWLRWFEHQGWVVDESRTQALRADLNALRKARWLKSNSFILAPKSRAHGVSLNGAAKHKRINA